MRAGFCGKHAGTGVCLNIPSRYLHWSVSEHSFLAYVLRRAVSLLCVIFAPNSGYIARYEPFLWHKSSPNCDAYLPESNFQTRSGAGMSGSGSLPTAGGSAWKNQSAVGYRKADFVSGNRAAEVLGNHRVKHIGKHGRLKSGSVGID